MPSQTKRKVTKHGGSLTITLPQGWVDYYGVEKGDTLKVVVDGTLEVCPPKKKESEEE